MSDREFPVAGVEMSVLLVVEDIQRARTFYRHVLGATEVRECGATSAVLQFQGTWLLLVTGGGPTPDKPTIEFRAPVDRDTVSHELTIKVPDCRQAYQTLLGRGAEFLKFLTPLSNTTGRSAVPSGTRTVTCWRSVRPERSGPLRPDCSSTDAVGPAR